MDRVSKKRQSSGHEKGIVSAASSLHLSTTSPVPIDRLE